jgi:hypothetical protein
MNHFTAYKCNDKHWPAVGKTELLQLNCTQFPSLGIFASKNVGKQKN